MSYRLSTKKVLGFRVLCVRWTIVLRGQTRVVSAGSKIHLVKLDQFLCLEYGYVVTLNLKVTKR